VAAELVRTMVLVAVVRVMAMVTMVRMMGGMRVMIRMSRMVRMVGGPRTAISIARKVDLHTIRSENTNRFASLGVDDGTASTVILDFHKCGRGANERKDVESRSLSKFVNG